MTPDDLDPTLPPPSGGPSERSVAGFPVLREIGRGGMGVVYLARQPTLDRLIALKVLHAGASQDPEMVSRFTREARAAALTHASIVPIYLYGDSEDGLYLAMAYMAGGSLRQVLRARRTLGGDETIFVGQQIARALAHAHSRGIVHRDVKPSNILLDEEGNAYLSDFGIAHLSDATRLTQTQAHVGTTEYMAPELVQGHAASPASDVYALGAALYECLSGKPPFTAEDPLAVLYQHRFEQVPTLPETVRSDVADVILGALAKDPSQRPDAMGFAVSLQRIGAGRHVVAMPAGDVTPKVDPLDVPTRTSAPSSPAASPADMRETRIQVQTPPTVPPAPREAAVAPRPRRASPAWLRRAPLKPLGLIAASLVLVLTGGMILAGGDVGPPPEPPVCVATPTPTIVVKKQKPRVVSSLLPEGNPSRIDPTRLTLSSRSIYWLPGAPSSYAIDGNDRKGALFRGRGAVGRTVTIGLGGTYRVTGVSIVPGLKVGGSSPYGWITRVTMLSGPARGSTGLRRSLSRQGLKGTPFDGREVELRIDAVAPDSEGLVGLGEIVVTGKRLRWVVRTIAPSPARPSPRPSPSC